jgi:flagellar protein FliS
VNNPYEGYIKTELETLSLPGLVAKGYDRIILELKGAIENIDKGDVKGKIQHISKALDILNTLLYGLDFEKGGEIAQNLSELYSFCIKEIQLANLKNDKKRLEDVINILNTLKGGWEELVQKV